MDLRFELPEINTWRLYNKGIDQVSVMNMVEAWELHGYRFGCVCIDDGWTADGKLGDWKPDRKRFPDLKGLVDWIHQRGYAVRLWVAPIQVHPGTSTFEKVFPDHVLRDGAGQPAFYTGLGTFRIDPRTAIGEQHVRETMQRLTRDYGIDAYKVDFPPFYQAHDEFYQQAGFAFSEQDNATMVPNFYRLVRESLDAVNPAVRVECARDLPGCEPYINDTICGDLVGEPRSLQELTTIVQRLKSYASGNRMVPWLEMVWGEGAQAPTRETDWYAGFLEYIALSINFGLKIEHSFLPFDYPNAQQIRALTNLYGPRNLVYKVLRAGRKEFPVTQLLQAGIELNAKTRLLVAPEEDVTQTLHTLELRTNAIDWRCRDLLEDRSVPLRARNEFWAGTSDACLVSFEAQRHHVYELWCEGEENDFFEKLYRTYVL
jgi:hypothetical protein